MRRLQATRKGARGRTPRPSFKRALAGALLLALFSTFLFGGFAWAGDPSGSATGTAADVTAEVAGEPTGAELAAELGHVKTSLNLFLVIFGGALVFLMQANDDFLSPTITTIARVAKTGNTGDGKIFVLDLAECIRIRTGETGTVAIG